ncbi:hypothetical protein D1646_15125 [Pseudoflavonifractor sp. 60]|uniref:hypothetical protein n=1 Tax=Pseudoflavonifractor sp. 60 TaxID=2304576 RepID=UPI00136F51D7|nr:hypothetical protein [Pseudoflavonifractor sp. 60]NBI68110.1 hypothetical protein [Pseudoflavonifractor sp. 60]
MDSNKQGITNALTQYAIDLLSIVLPFAAPTVDLARSISETLLCQKLYQVLTKQDADFEEWLKFSENFDSDNRNYEKTVRQLIYTIEAINEIDMLDIYANLLRSYKAGSIAKSDFFRLGWVLSNIFSMDLMYLNECKQQINISESPVVKRLEQYGLVRIVKSEVLFNTGVKNIYMLSELGEKMISYGINCESQNG